MEGITLQFIVLPHINFRNSMIVVNLGYWNRVGIKLQFITLGVWGLGLGNKVIRCISSLCDWLTKKRNVSAVAADKRK